MVPAYRVMKALCSASLNLYRMMLQAKGMEVEQLMILHLKKDGTYKLIRFDMDDAVPNALLTLHKVLQTKRRATK